MQTAEWSDSAGLKISIENLSSLIFVKMLSKQESCLVGKKTAC
jgi:hypothetical protein